MGRFKDKDIQKDIFGVDQPPERHMMCAQIHTSKGIAYHLNTIAACLPFTECIETYQRFCVLTVPTSTRTVSAD